MQGPDTDEVANKMRWLEWIPKHHRPEQIWQLDEDSRRGNEVYNINLRSEFCMMCKEMRRSRELSAGYHLFENQESDLRIKDEFKTSMEPIVSVKK